MDLETNKRMVDIKDDIKRIEGSINLLSAKTGKLNLQIKKLENKTSLNLTEKTKIHHLKHELKNRLDEIEQHKYSIEILRDQLTKLEA
jgi:ubiquinone biosynthesis protein UbiJ